MKKSIVKALSAFLALVLILSALPMAAFAAEVEVSPCATCSHNFNVTHDVPVVTGYSAAGHTVKYVDRYTCTKCSYSYTVNTGVTEVISHTLKKEIKAYMVDADGNQIPVFHMVCTTCGYTS